MNAFSGLKIKQQYGKERVELNVKSINPCFIAADGVQLAASSYGDSGHQVVLLLHGAGQTRYSWRSTATILAENGYRAITVDTRGHGESDWSESGDYSIDTLILDLTTIVDRLAHSGEKRPIAVGASLGGITALLAEGEALNDLFQALVLVDITPQIDPAGVAKILNFMSAFSRGFESVEQASEAVAGFQSHRKPVRKSDNTGLKKNLRLKADGRYYWHWDPRLLDSVSHFGQQLVDRQKLAATNLTLPVLLVHGQFSEIVSRDSAEEFLRLVPQAHYINVADAAHMVASDDNQVFAKAVLDFIRKSVE